jgi:cob(I)alamin adenosyltransferase
MKIYTKTGDKGETGLWGGGRLAKNTARIHAYGTIDECNAVLGIVRTFEIDKEIDEMLAGIQDSLFVCGTDLATPGDKEVAIDRISEKDTVQIENWIDHLDASLSRLKQFIVPGGSPAAAYLHLARTVCRRAERWTVTVVADDVAHQNVLKYLNRLSDFLFVAARAANKKAGVADVSWLSPRRKKDWAAGRSIDNSL